MSFRFALALLSVLLAPAARADIITLRADEWCPYNCAETSDRPGYAVEIAREVFSRAGHSVEYRTMAWSRALQECRKGLIAGVVGAAHTEVPDFVFPQEPVAVADITFVVKKGSAWRYDGPASLETVKVGGILGYSYDGPVGDYVHAHARDDRRVELIGGDTALEMNLKKLLVGRIDVTMDAGPVLAYKLMQLKLGDKVELAGSVDPTENFIAFSPVNPKSREYAAILDRGIAEMRASGRLRQILQRYGVKDWK
jgi:polar amino acid transport system substrate-binding protein